MSRLRWQLRDAALGYASRGIPVLPLHYPLPHRNGLQPLGGDQQPVESGCSCRDPGCGQPAKHPLGPLVPHGVKDASCNRARILAWWTCHPQATTVRHNDPATKPRHATETLSPGRRALPAGSTEPTANGRVGARLQAAYAHPRPDGQAWTARTLAEAAGCGRSSAASFLQRQRPATAEEAR